ncbi:hypothetical protein [Streptomyces roseofulvus]|uniref:hypothetical protein n=1 Tax=Streptomyces roseofulvus TaxID=33902 RepID=UPI0031FC8643
MGQWQERQEQSEDNIRMASRAAAAENARALSNNAVPPLVRRWRAGCGRRSSAMAPR